MAEHGLTTPVIGLSLDGTGYGLDARIWGGEVLICRLDHFARFAHLQYIPIPGGETAIHEPWRMAFAHLDSAGFSEQNASQILGVPNQETRLLSRMMERGINSPLTSSLGRLFDAVAAVVLNRRSVDYEAQAAIELEGIAAEEKDAPAPAQYIPQLSTSGAEPELTAELRIDGVWHALIEDLNSGVSRPTIAARFHAGIAEGFIGAAIAARNKTGISVVALSGGCMHNRRLSRLLRVGLEQHGFQVLQHRAVSPGDGGLSYGQAVVATAILSKETPR
jgi:hydrogenase maturation protein HypF